jgi:hypothetical protein
VFAARITGCGAAAARYVDWRLEDVLRGAPGAATTAARRSNCARGVADENPTSSTLRSAE